MPPKNGWKDEANHYTAIHDFQNVLAEGLDGLTSFVPALFSQKAGRMKVAEQGTLFLDEVGDIPIEIQPKLSRALRQRNLNAGQFPTIRFNSAIAEYHEAPVTSLQLTYTGVLLAVFGNQLCLPIPSIVFLMAAGAMSADGGMRTSIIVFLSVLGCLAADGIWFWFGRRWGSQAIRLLCRLTADPRSCSNNARKKFRHHGLPVLCVSKFVPGLDALMPPLCGAEGVSLAGFFAFDTVGSLLWSGCYIGLGYLFSNELDAAIRWTAHFGAAVGIALGVPLGLYAGWRGLVLVRMIRRLRVRRITPPMLARKLRSNMKVAVLDLLNFEEETEGESLEAIPGAFSVDASRLRKSPQITVPDDVEIILYCSSRRDVKSARVAVALKRIGIDRVWVLEGGLKAWREQGFPVAQSLELPEVVAKRLGVKLPEP